MKTISGKQNIIDESILRSVNAGGISMVEEFLKKKFPNGGYTINNDLSVDLTSSNAVFYGHTEIPFWIKTVKNLGLEKCKIESFTLPKKALTVEIKDCDNLKKLRVNGSSEIDVLTIENCSELIDLSEIKDLNVKVVKIFKCNNLKSFKGLENVVKLIQIKSCKKLRTYDFKSNYSPDIVINHCPIKYFEETIISPYIKFTNLVKVNSLNIKIGFGTNLSIENCKELESIKISGDKVETIVIDSCDELQNVSIGVDCSESFSFVNLPKIENYELPQKVSGIIVFEEVKTIPDVNCKRIIKR